MKQTALQRYVKAMFKYEMGLIISDDAETMRGEKAFRRLEHDIAAGKVEPPSKEDESTISDYESFLSFAGLWITQYGAFSMQAAYHATLLQDLVTRVRAAETIHNQLLQRPLPEAPKTQPDPEQFKALDIGLLMYTKPFDDPENVAGEGVAPSIIGAIQHNDGLARAMYTGPRNPGYRSVMDDYPIADHDGTPRIGAVVDADEIVASYSDLADVKFMHLEWAVKNTRRTLATSFEYMRRSDFFSRVLARHVGVPIVSEILSPAGMNRLAQTAANRANRALRSLATVPIIRFSRNKDPRSNMTPATAGRAYVMELQDRIRSFTSDATTGSIDPIEPFEPVPDSAVRRAAKLLNSSDVTSLSAINSFIVGTIPPRES